MKKASMATAPCPDGCGEKHTIQGKLRLDPLGAKRQPGITIPDPALENGNYVTHLGIWLRRLNLEGKQVKITVEELR